MNDSIEEKLATPLRRIGAGPFHRAIRDLRYGGCHCGAQSIGSDARTAMMRTA